MYYSSLFIKQKGQVPKPLIVSAFVSILLLIIVILIKPSIPSRANSAAFLTLQQVNIDSNKVGIFWHTEESVSGVIRYGKDVSSLNQYVIDERDLENKSPGKFRSHYMLLKNLQPNTNYYYQAIYNGKQSQIDKINTPTKVISSVSAKPIFGKIIQLNGQPIQNGVILLEMDGFFPLLTTTKASGEWLLSIEQFMAKKTQKIQMESWSEKASIIVKIIDENGLVSVITGSYLALISNKKDYIIGRNYNLYEDSDIKGVQTSQLSASNDIDILYPKENSVVPAKSPLIKGFALPNKEVYLSLNTQPQYNFRIFANDKGEWKDIVSPTVKAGRYIISMKTENEKGELITITRNFSIAKSGEQVLGTATPEANPTITNQPILPTLLPISPTTEVVLTATSIPPVTGQVQTVQLFLISAVALIVGAGFILAF